MHIDPHTGWCDSARRCPSPNCNARPQAEVSLLVIHNISLPPGEFGGGYVQQLFAGQLDPTGHPYFAGVAALRVSAHFLIERDGTVTQFVSCDRRAWHAGQSCYAGRQACNDFSIGIELEGTDLLPYSERQYQSLATLTRALQQAYPALHAWRISGHQHIAPGRKSDPGPAFDWQRYFRDLAVLRQAR